MCTIQLDSNMGPWGAYQWTQRPFIPRRTCHLLPATFQLVVLPLEPIETSGLGKGFSFFFFFFKSAHKQTDWVWCLTHFSSFLSQRLCRQYNYSTSVVHSCSEQISLFCLKNKHRQLSDLVPILPSVSATLIEGSCLPSYVLLHASFEETQLSLVLEKTPLRCSYRLFMQSLSTVVF